MKSPLSFSFELFPPRTPEGMTKLPGVIGQLAAVRPDYFSVTHGAGGSDQEGTYETLLAVVEHAGMEAAPHLTCVGSTRAHVAAHLPRYREAGVKRIVALRGDLPATAMSAAAPGEFHYANELVSFIRESTAMHSRSRSRLIPRCIRRRTSPGADFDHFRRKVEAGADAALTQLFYNADAYFHFMERCAKAGIKIPIVPGIMPITSYANTLRFCNGCGADLPRWVRLRLEELAVRQAGAVRLRPRGGDAAVRNAAARTARRGCTSTPSTRPSRRCGCGRICDCRYAAEKYPAPGTSAQERTCHAVNLGLEANGRCRTIGSHSLRNTASVVGFMIGLPIMVGAYYESFKARQEARRESEGTLHSPNCLEFIAGDGTCINLVPLETLHSLPREGDVLLLPGDGVGGSIRLLAWSLPGGVHRAHLYAGREEGAAPRGAAHQGRGARDVAESGDDRVIRQRSRLRDLTGLAALPLG